MKHWNAVILATCVLGAAGALAHGDDKGHTYDASKVEDTDFGREGDPRKVSRTVKVDMTDAMRFTPASVSVKRGETIRFVVRNDGKQLHEMVLGTVDAIRAHAELMKKFPGMEHADPNMAHVKPGATGEIVWQFSKAGDFRFACLQPGHYAAGMVGKVIVK